MKIIFIDCPANVYSDKTKASVPANICGKFVQMRHHDTEYLVLSPLEYAAYHADIVKLFCLGNEIDGLYLDSHKRYDIHDPSWVVLGGGKFDLDSGRKLIRLYDNSMAYGKFDPTGLKERIQLAGVFTGYQIIIE